MVSAGAEAVRRVVPRIPDQEHKEKERKGRFRGRLGKSPQCNGRFQMTFQQCCCSPRLEGAAAGQENPRLFPGPRSEELAREALCAGGTLSHRPAGASGISPEARMFAGQCESETPVSAAAFRTPDVA